MAWLRLDASSFEDRALRRAGMDGKLAFVAALMLTKSRDWQREEKRGWLPKREFDGLEVALHWGTPTDEATIARFDAAIHALTLGPSPLLIAAEDGWWFANWEKYQPDPRALARKRLERRRQFAADKAEREATEKAGKAAKEAAKAETKDTAKESRDATAAETQSEKSNVVTVTDGTNRDEASAGSEVKPVEEHPKDCHDKCCLTRRDETLRDEYEYETKTSTSTSTSHDKQTDTARPSDSAVGGARRTASPVVLAEGVAIQGGYVPCRELPADLPNPADKIAALRSILDAAPRKPMVGPPKPPDDAPPKVADPAKIEALRQESLAKLRDLERRENEAGGSA